MSISSQLTYFQAKQSHNIDQRQVTKIFPTDQIVNNQNGDDFQGKRKHVMKEFPHIPASQRVFHC